MSSLFKRSFILTVIFTVLFISLAPLHGLAEDADDADEVGALLDEESIEEMNDEANYFERTITGVMMSIPNFFIRVLGARDVTYLVFQQEEHASAFNSDSNPHDGFRSNADEMYFGVFPVQYFEALGGMYDSIASLIPIPLAMLFALAGLVLLSSNFSDESRVNWKSYLAGAFFVVVGLRFGHMLWGILFDINNFLVNIVWASLEENNISRGLFLDTIFGSGNLLEQGFILSIGAGILAFVAFFMTFILNYQYAMRFIMLSMLILLFPIVLLTLIFPSRREAFSIWVAEFASNVFLQTAHAFALGLFFVMRHYIPDLSFWFIAAFLMGLPTVSVLVQRMISGMVGVQPPQGAGGTAGGTMIGIASMMQVSRMMGKASGKDGKTGSGSPDQGGSPNTAASSNQKGSDSQGITPSSAGGKQPPSSTGKTTLSTNGTQITVSPSSQGVTKSATPDSKTQGTSGNSQSQGTGPSRSIPWKEGLKTSAKVAGAGSAVMLGGGMTAMATGNPQTGMLLGGIGSVGAQSLAGKASDYIKDRNEPDQTYDEALNNGNPEHPPETVDSGTHSIVPIPGNPSTSHQPQLADASQGIKSLPSGAQRIGQGAGDPIPHHNYKGGDLAGATRQQVSQAQARQETLQANGASPTQTQTQQRITEQAKTNHQQAQRVNYPNDPTMSTPVGAINQVTQSTMNYQESLNTLQQIDPVQEPEAYQQAQENVALAENIANQSVETSMEMYPDILNPRYEDQTREYMQAVENDDPSAKEKGEALNQRIEKDMKEQEEMRKHHHDRQGRGRV